MTIYHVDVENQIEIVFLKRENIYIQFEKIDLQCCESLSLSEHFKHDVVKAYFIETSFVASCKLCRTGTCSQRLWSSMQQENLLKNLGIFEFHRFQRRKSQKNTAIMLRLVHSWSYVSFVVMKNPHANRLTLFDPKTWDDCLQRGIRI